MPPKRDLVQKVKVHEFELESVPRSCTWVFIAPPASGKCLGRGVRVKTLEPLEGVLTESSKAVEDIVEGDMLVGDVCAQIVQNTSVGHGELYRVSLVREDTPLDFVCNREHVLVLYNTTLEKTIDLELFRYFELSVEYKAMLKAVHYDTSKTGVLEPTYYDFAIEKVCDDGEYFGFTLAAEGEHGEGEDGNGSNGRFLLENGILTHNTTLIENFAYYFKHRYPVAKIFIGSDDYTKFCNIFHPLYVSNKYDVESEKQYVARQKNMAKSFGKGYAGNYSLHVIDDIGENKSDLRSNVIESLFKKGSQHYNQLCMFCIHGTNELPPVARSSTDFAAIGRFPEETTRKALFQTFGGVAGTQAGFNDLMNQLTGNYTFLIVKKRTQSQLVEECFFWFKTKKMDFEWKFGCKEYRKWAKTRYDKNYVDPYDQF